MKVVNLIGRSALIAYSILCVFLFGFLAGGDYRDMERREQIATGANIYLRFSKADAAVFQCKPVVIVNQTGQHEVQERARCDR